MNEPTINIEKTKCPACKGRGGFDGPEDCFTCAWCGGTGRASVEDIVNEGVRLANELRRAIEERNRLRADLAAIVRCGDSNSHDIALAALERKI